MVRSFVVVVCNLALLVGSVQSPHERLRGAQYSFAAVQQQERAEMVSCTNKIDTQVVSSQFKSLKPALTAQYCRPSATDTWTTLPRREWRMLSAAQREDYKTKS